MRIIPRAVNTVNGKDFIPKTPTLAQGFLHAGKKVILDHCHNVNVLNCHHATRYYKNYIKHIGYSSKFPNFSKLGN